MRYLNAVGGGRITRIVDNMAYVDDDGFETPVLLRECVVVQKAQPTPKGVAAPAAPKPAVAVTDTKPQPEPVEETPGGDTLNIVIGFEAVDSRHISSTPYECYLINDSNYYLQYTFASRADDAEGWTLISSGIVEPNIQLLLADFAHDDVTALDRISLQAVAYKEDKPFVLKNAISVEHRVDTTKFFKLHCFREHPYFERPALTFNIVHNDVAERPNRVPAAEDIEREMQRKKSNDARPVRQPVKKHKKEGNETLVIDLHITELLDNTHGLSPADILNVQIDEFRRVMDQNLRNHGKKIVFIHGKGEGVLRQALMKELNYKYKGHDVQDASFREYGFGATQVTIR